MSETSNTDLAVQIAKLEGKVDGYVFAQQARDVATTSRLDTAAGEVQRLQSSLERVTAWQNKITGGLILLAALQTTADIAAAIWVGVTHH